MREHLYGWMVRGARQLNWRPRRDGHAKIIAVLSVTQWLAWGSTYYLVTILAQPIATDTGWPLASVIAGLSIGLIIAGLISPLVGKAIERHNGRPVLALGAIALALGLTVLGLAQNQVTYFSAWTILGIGMGASLYDAAFAALGKLYGMRARPMIGRLTLTGGLAITVTWPLSAVLLASLGWRGVCFFYASMHLAVGLPLLLFLLPNVLPDTNPLPGSASLPQMHPSHTPQRQRLFVWLVGTNLTLQIGLGSVLAVHLLSLLQDLGLETAMAVALGSLMGICQVAGRLIEVVLARRLHPVWEGIAASVLVFVGFVLLMSGGSMLVGVALAVYGLGNGIRTIVKGTLPLVLFGAEGYATLIGRLGMPTLIAQAVGPALGALVLSHYGVRPTLAMLTVIAFTNLVLSYTLRIALPRHTAATQDLSTVTG